LGAEKVVVLRDDQADLSEAWAAAQWKVVLNWMRA
jgi:hypothetical protein